MHFWVWIVVEELLATEMKRFGWEKVSIFYELTARKRLSINSFCSFKCSTSKLIKLILMHKLDAPIITASGFIALILGRVLLLLYYQTSLSTKECFFGSHHHYLHPLQIECQLRLTTIATLSQVTTTQTLACRLPTSTSRHLPLQKRSHFNLLVYE